VERILQIVAFKWHLQRAVRPSSLSEVIYS
jgi:hypothetical protein